MNTIFFDANGTLRSGWRAAVFLFAYIFFAVLLGTAARTILAAIDVPAANSSHVFLVVTGILSLIPAIGLGWLAGKYFEKLPLSALGASFIRGWFTSWLVGLLAGALTLSFAIVIPIVFAGLRFEVNQIQVDQILAGWAVSFAVFGVMAAFEEALFRGYILQTFVRSGYGWLAIILTSTFFGAVHAGNPNASAFSIANTMIAGVWFSVAYLKTRDLWFVWGMHLMWNWMQGSFFGVEVSGLTEIASLSLLKEIDSGPRWLTGENYGIEGGIACTVALIVSTAVVHFIPIKKDISPLP